MCIRDRWLYHIGVPAEKIDTLAHDACNTTTCFMPYINAFFQPRKESDRPKVVPDGAVNFAFIGQFAETSYLSRHSRIWNAVSRIMSTVWRAIIKYI